MGAPYCAECGDHVAPDTEHVVVHATVKKPDDRNDVEDYMFHTECFRDLSDDWMIPA